MTAAALARNVTDAHPQSLPPARRTPKRARRPASHHLGLTETFHLLDTAWKLAEDGHHRTYANALRVEVAMMTGLRIGELHNLRPSDIRPDGTINVRMLRAEDSPWKKGLKYAKPRITSWVNGQEESPTLKILQDYIHGAHRPRGRAVGRGDNKTTPDPEAYIWPSQPAAWHAWVVKRLGYASGLQRLLPKLNGTPADKGEPRYLIHPHAFRACFVMICRRWPRTLGLEPLPWEAVCALGGWENVATVLKSYYYAELDETMAQLRASLPAARAPQIARPMIANGDRRGKSW